MAVSESNMAEFKMAAMFKLSEIEWVKFFFVQNGWIQDGRVPDGCHHHIESEWMSEVFFVQMVGTNLGKCEWDWEEKLLWLNPRWWNSSWQNSRWLPSSSWVRMNKWIFICAKWMNPIWQNSIWLPSTHWVRINEWNFFCTKWLNPRWLPSSIWVRMNDFESDWISWSQRY